MREILVVDDEFDVSDVISSILESDGYKVASCSNGREAIAHLRSNPPPSLVLLDIMMPYANGYEVMRAIKATPGLEDVPVILMSSIAPSMKPHDLGWAAFLRKPFTLDRLVSLVTEYAGKPEAEGQG